MPRQNLTGRRNKFAEPVVYEGEADCAAPFFMNATSTAPSSRHTLRSLAGDVFELLGSMRFAVSLLMFICIASIVGTVLAQNRPSNVYVDQFGPFWFEVFDKFSIWHVYNSWWFLLIMTFLVVSTSVCLIRNTLKMLREARSFREHVRASSLRAFRTASRPRWRSRSARRHRA